jgi:hypothetical protein
MRIKHLVVFFAVLALGSTAAVLSTPSPASAGIGVDTTLGANPNPSTLGQSVTFSATVHGIFPAFPVGGVIFFDGATPMNFPVILQPNFSCVGPICVPDGTSTATFSTSTLSGGTHIITAAADSTYGASVSDPLIQTVIGATTTTTVTAAPASPTVFGQGVTFTASVVANPSSVGTPSGTVQFTDNGVNLGGTQTLSGGSTSVTSSGLSVGAHNIVASYTSDNPTFISSSGHLNQQVNMASTMTGVASTANPSVFGQPITLTATVGALAPGAGAPTGTVSFADGSTSLGAAPISGGQATITTAGLSVGPHSLSATYNGDGNFIASTGTLSQTVNRAPIATTVVSSANPSVFGQKVTFSATICPLPPSTMPTKLPSGMVDFTADGASTPFDTVTVSGASAPPGCESATSAPIGTFSVATHSITASYVGDANFLASSGALSGGQVVNKAPTATALTSAPNPSFFGDGVTLTATVSVPPPGAGVPTGTVTFTDGATILGTGTLNAADQVTFTTAGLQVGTHSIAATYGGDGDFLPSTSTPQSQLVRCMTVITGRVNGGLTVSGSTCVNNATVNGGITVRPGAALSLNSSTVHGGVTSASAKALTVCATSIDGSSTVTATSGFVLFGDNGDDGYSCGGNDQQGTLILAANAGQIELGGNQIRGGASISGTFGVGPTVENAITEIEGNQVSGQLSCTNNTPSPIDDGSPNHATGGGTGQCSAPNF